jgi:hypothetical protein
MLCNFMLILMVYAVVTKLTPTPLSCNDMDFTCYGLMGNMMMMMMDFTCSHEATATVAGGLLVAWCAPTANTGPRQQLHCTVLPVAMPYG